MKKVKVIQEECTLHWAIPPFKATKAKTKSILEKIMSNIYCISRSMQCYIIAQSKSVSFENELTKLKQLTQNKNQVKVILIKCFQILLSREDA